MIMFRKRLTLGGQRGFTLGGRDAASPGYLSEGPRSR